MKILLDKSLSKYFNNMYIKYIKKFDQIFNKTKSSIKFDKDVAHFYTLYRAFYKEKKACNERYLLTSTCTQLIATLFIEFLALQMTQKRLDRAQPSDTRRR